MTSNPGQPCLPLPLRAIVTPVPPTALATTGAVPKQARSNLAIYDPCPALSTYRSTTRGCFGQGFLLAGLCGELAVDEGCAGADRADEVGCVHGAAAILG